MPRGIGGETSPPTSVGQMAEIADLGRCPKARLMNVWCAATIATDLSVGKPLSEGNSEVVTCRAQRTWRRREGEGEVMRGQSKGRGNTNAGPALGLDVSASDNKGRQAEQGEGPRTLKSVR